LEADDDALGRALGRGVAFALRHGRAVVAAILLFSLLGGMSTVRWLGFNVDPNDLFSDDLRFQQMIRSFEEHFPQLTNSLLVVVDADTPERAREAADALAARLRERGDAFTSVYFPGEEDFFERHGLLYQSVDDLDELTLRLAELQPVIGTLASDPSLASLAWVVRTGLEQAPTEGAEVEHLRSVLDHFRRATIAVYDEYPLHVSWESVLLSGTPFDPQTRRVIVADPILAFDRILAAEPAIEAVRESVATLGGAMEGARVRITGYPALNHEEFLGLAADNLTAGGLSFLLVIVILTIAFRSAAVVGAAALTLLCGFAWTAAYATAVVGKLNPASIAFAVLFIGLGVDFMIHLGMHVAEEVRSGADVPTAIDRATRSTGSALVLCAATTAIGFLAFLPTDYKGVSELGVISAGGMLVIVFQTLTLFPVLMSWGLRGRALESLRNRRPFTFPLGVSRRPRWVVGVATLAALGGLYLAPRARIETNVIALRNPDTESVQTFEDLLGSELTTPWYADILAPDLATARRLAEEARALPGVRRAITVSDYVPSDQEEKLAILEDAALFMDLPPAGGAPAESDVEAQIAALRELVAFLGAESLERGRSDLARSGVLLRDNLARFLARIDAEPDPRPAIEALETSLLGSVPTLVGRLQKNLATDEVRFEDLPPRLVRRMLAPDGTARVQVFPREDLSERAAMVRFVESVRTVSEDLTGLPVNLVESSYVTNRSLRLALALALGVVTALLLGLWGRPAETAIALAPLVLAVLLTAAATWVFGISLNFINVCVLPLLLGVGIDSGVHMVHRARSVPVASGALLTSTTAQAVCFSALTTLASFGTLILSSHRGIASLGTLLVIGMAFTLLGNLVLLPALLQLWKRGGQGASGGADEAANGVRAPSAAPRGGGEGRRSCARTGPRMGRCAARDSGGAGAGGRASGLRLGLDGRGVRLRRLQPARLPRGAYPTHPPRHGGGADRGPLPGEHRDDGADDRCARGRRSHDPGPRRLRTPDRGRLVRPAVGKAVLAHARHRRDPAPGVRARGPGRACGAGDRAALPRAGCAGDRQAPQVDSPYRAQPADLARNWERIDGPADGRGGRWLAALRLRPRDALRLPALAGRGLPARRRGKSWDGFAIQASCHVRVTDDVQAALDATCAASR
jgi:uncharacterized protein